MYSLITSFPSFLLPRVEDETHERAGNGAVADDAEDVVHDVGVETGSDDVVEVVQGQRGLGLGRAHEQEADRTDVARHFLDPHDNEVEEREV